MAAEPVVRVKLAWFKFILWMLVAAVVLSMAVFKPAGWFFVQNKVVLNLERLEVINPRPARPFFTMRTVRGIRYDALALGS